MDTVLPDCQNCPLLRSKQLAKGISVLDRILVLERIPVLRRIKVRISLGGIPPRRRVNRRRILSFLLKGGGIVGLGVSTLSTGDLLLMAFLKQAPPQGGSSLPAANTAQSFTNPQDGKQGLLIRLPNGTFVAYERACTHAGVYVDYDPQTHLLVCPAHGAVFDPSQKASVVTGPATNPLPEVPLRTRSDGTPLIGNNVTPSAGH